MLPDDNHLNLYFVTLPENTALSDDQAMADYTTISDSYQLAENDTERAEAIQECERLIVRVILLYIHPTTIALYR